MEIGNLVHAFFDNSGPGGIVIILVFFLGCFIYALLARWILAGGKDQS